MNNSPALPHDALRPIPAHAHRPRRFTSLAAILVALCALAACSGTQIHSTSQHQDVSLTADSLRRGGIAFITPSTVTGQEEDKQELAYAVANVMCKALPGTRCVTLAESLSLVNGAGLANEYKRMYDDYRDTGIFNRDPLKKISEVAGVRYLVQLKMANFTQGSKDRFGVLGLRIMETRTGNMRLLFQIWDGSNGSVAWEGSEEVSYAFETTSERGPALRMVAEEATRRVIANLPK